MHTGSSLYTTAMKLLDNALSVLAPHTCLGCGHEGSVLCDNCLLLAGEPPASRCVGCKKLTDNYRTCRSCRSWIDIHSVYVATKYEGVYEQLVRSYKFDLKRQAVEPMAAIILQLPIQFEETSILCSVPTAPSRIRQRGFDHMRLLSRSLWRHLPSKAQTALQLEIVLSRKSNVRQLGSSRVQRIKQMEDEFFVKDASVIAGKTVVLLDDVTTTGASLAAAAKTLKAAGAKRVYGLVFAQKV